jgi:hypothetical protein
VEPDHVVVGCLSFLYFPERNTLTDIFQRFHTLWKDEKEDIPARRKTRKYHLIPTGWKEWWLRVETDTES